MTHTLRDLWRLLAYILSECSWNIAQSYRIAILKCSISLMAKLRAAGLQRDGMTLDWYMWNFNYVIKSKIW